MVSENACMEATQYLDALIVGLPFPSAVRYLGAVLQPLQHVSMAITRRRRVLGMNVHRGWRYAAEMQ